jgi:ferredoxin--NADP+ reductase
VKIRFRFFDSPVELIGDADGHLAAVRVERTEIAARPGGSLAARSTGDFGTVPAELLFRSIGYTGVAVGDLPFDAERGVIRNVGGRVTDEDGTPLRGEYVTGSDQARPVGRDRHEQEGFTGHRRQAAGRRARGRSARTAAR